MVGPGGEVAVEALGRSLVAGRVNLAPVEAGPLLRVAHKIVGSRHALELLFAELVAQLLRQTNLRCASEPSLSADLKAVIVRVELRSNDRN